MEPSLQVRCDDPMDAAGCNCLHADNVSEWMPQVYAGLRRLAHHYLQSESPGHTLQTTALVHEAYLRLSGHDGRIWNSKREFYAAAAQAMRRTLIDWARRKRSLRRGGSRPGAGSHRIELGHVAYESDEALQILALNEALDKLRTVRRRCYEILMFRYFAGLTIQQTAEMISVSAATAKRELAAGRAWLYVQLRDETESRWGARGSDAG